MFKITKKCDDDKCFPTGYKLIHPGSTGGNNPTDKTPDLTNLTSSYVLNNGVIIGGIDENRYIVFDINGPKSPNTAGYDLWFARINKDGSLVDKAIPDNSYVGDTNLTEEDLKEKCSIDDGTGCLGVFVANGFKIPDYPTKKRSTN